MAGAHGSVTYYPNETGIHDLGFLPGMRAFTTDMAERYAPVVKKLSPLGLTGRVRKAIRITVAGADRVSAYTDVRGSWSWWHFVEYGTMHQPPAHPFREAAESLGFRWVDRGGAGD